MAGTVEKGLALEPYSELKELQARFEQFGGGKGERLGVPVGCESESFIYQRIMLLF